MLIFSIVFVLLLSCSVVTPPNLVVVVGGVTEHETSNLSDEKIGQIFGYVFNLMFFKKVLLTYFFVRSSANNAVESKEDGLYVQKSVTQNSTRNEEVNTSVFHCRLFFVDAIFHIF
jgi:hypothetical protein